MRTLTLIRTCPKDEELAIRCYVSFKRKAKCDVVFFAERPVEDYSKSDILRVFAPTMYRPKFDNFGGRDNVIPYLEELKRVNVDNYDYIILSDSDIQILKDPIDEDFDFGGIQDFNNFRHFSGQLLIFKTEIFKKVLEYELIYELTEELIEKGISIADDTVISWIATEYTNNTRNFFEKDYWIHSKRFNVRYKAKE